MADKTDEPPADIRRQVPSTTVLLGDPRLSEASARLGRPLVKAAVGTAQQLVREGRIGPGDAVHAALAALPAHTGGLSPVHNATGVVLHTNLGRAPLSRSALEAMAAAGGYTDVELDLSTGRRAPRGRGAMAALREAVPGAEAVHVVNNGAAALALAAVTLAPGRDILLSRGEFVEIGDGFRIPELLVSCGARIREVGTTNRTRLGDYADAAGPDTGFILKVHPSNFTVSGFTGGVETEELASLGLPVVVDIGSGLLAPDPVLPDEPDAATALRDGATLVTASGDKLLGGPQAGLVLGVAAVVERMRRHPLARALRVDKFTLAALEATLRGPEPPVHTAVHMPLPQLRIRTLRLAEDAGRRGLDARVVPHEAVVGGGGAPGTVLPSCALSIPDNLAESLRTGEPAVLGRVVRGRLLLDLRCVPEESDSDILAAVLRAAGR
ncbi:L-seryl-tRNA(Sec) selenium transferase [Streptomyces sp. NBC_01022]|uniref:L-seryl-tRNA(Sec) selenium transferase n=1 Tax=Streptomyces sp. NBC_01022 TaxID=2903723 RepID=UPI002DD85640|nr:L-seryl-tRNA(Sec) selenium transferase [Streptomyces sp. NBC_01022]WRZ80222.1 L-seryl-tRNA(Sec) selenium transferase [Streptomyces sp. NBC_01022]